MSRIQIKTYASTASSTSHSVTMDAAPTQGNLLILRVISDELLSGGPPSGWSTARTEADFPNGAIYYKTAGAGESATVNITLPASNCCILALEEWPQMFPQATVLDQVSSSINQNSAGTMTSGTTPATTQPNELVLALFGIDNSSSITFNSYTNSFVEDFDLRTTGSAVNVAAAGASKIVSATGAQETTVTTSAAGSSNDIGLIATFKINNAPQIQGVQSIAGIQSITF